MTVGERTVLFFKKKDIYRELSRSELFLSDIYPLVSVA